MEKQVDGGRAAAKKGMMERPGENRTAQREKVFLRKVFLKNGRRWGLASPARQDTIRRSSSPGCSRATLSYGCCGVNRLSNPPPPATCHKTGSRDWPGGLVSTTHSAITPGLALAHPLQLVGLQMSTAACRLAPSATPDCPQSAL